MRTLTQGPHSVRNKMSWLYLYVGIQLPSLSWRSGPCRSYVARVVLWETCEPSIPLAPWLLPLTHILSVSNEMPFQQLHYSYSPYHLMGSPHDNFVKSL